MSTCFARCLAFGLATTLAAASPALAQSSSDDQNRSDTAQAENQTTNDPQQSRSQQQESQQYEDQNNQSRQSRQDERGEFRDNQQNRRTERQDQRQDRRQESGRSGDRDRQPAIGVSVVERGGMGVRVMAVVPDSPADQSGIEAGDTILEVEGRRVSSAQQLVSLIQEQEAGDTAEFAVIRDGREYQVPVRLTTREQALPARLRRQDDSQDQGRRFGQAGQPPQNQQGQNWQRSEERGQQGQYDQQRQYGQDQYQQQYGQQQGQWDQGRQFESRNQYQQGQTGYGPPQSPSPYTGASQQYDSRTQQASYGEQGGQQRDRQLGERLTQRLSQFEQRLERLTQRLEQIERSGGLSFQAGSTDSDQTTTSPSQRTRSDEDHDSEDDDKDHDEEN